MIDRDAALELLREPGPEPHLVQHGLASEAVSPASHWTPAFLLPEASLEHSDLFSQKPFSFCFILLSQALTMAPRLAWISLCSADWP